MTLSLNLNPFRELALELRDSGHVRHAVAIEDVLNAAWSSPSEFLGELGLAVVSYRKACAPLAEPAASLVGACMQEVLKVWPDIGK